MTYAEKLLDPRWQKKRLEIFERDNWSCVKCGDRDTTLHVHHEIYFKDADPWDYDDLLLNTLCSECHSVEHMKLSYLERSLYEALLNRDRGNLGMIRLMQSFVRNVVKERDNGK